MTYWSASSGRALRSAAVLALVSPFPLLAQHQNGLLVGRVLSGDVAVPSATILVSGGRVTLARVDGRYRMSLPAGRYAVRARRIGYSSSRDSVTIDAGVTATVNFRLERAAAPLEAVAALGTRGAERSAIDALSPIEVIDGTQLRSTGRTETSRDLQAFSPSVNVSHETIGQASDLVHAFAMRGLSPDQVLVLVNGKRRHSSALVNTNRSLGRGSSGVDLDAIPASLIDHIEILHGDAVAEYGSDAIAGVVNVVLKNGVHGTAMSTVGENSTSFNRDGDASLGSPPASQSATDGRAMQASIDKGVVFGERGFLHGGFEVRDRGTSERALPDTRFPSTSVAPHYGDARNHDVALMLNGGNLFDNGLDVYANVGGSRRTIGAPGAYTSDSPNALPVVRGTLDDYAGTVGVRGQLDDWSWDLSSVYGRNRVGLSLSPAVNPDLGVTLQQLDAGAQRFSQSTTNLELRREYPLFEELRVAVGGEYRRDAYGVDAGEPASYSPQAFVAGSWEGLPSFTPAQSVTAARHEVGGYLDMETDLTNDIVLGAAGRVEHYSDVGNQPAGKLSLRYEPMRNYVLRGSIARGFRAPSLQQSVLGATYADPYVGIVDLLAPTDPRVAAIGGSPLRAEQSNDYQVGVAVVLSRALSFTLDAYRTDLNDRIVLRDIFIGTLSANPSHFFQNGASTRTDGLDATLSYGLRFADGASLRLTGGANVNHTSLLSLTTVTPSGSAVPMPVLSDIEVTRLTRGEPRDNLLASAVFALHDLGAMVRVQRFGSFTGIGNGADPVMDQTFAARWITDANLSYTLARKYTFTAGADNLFDVYPQRGLSSVFFSNAGISPYPSGSPFGFNGRFVYGRLSIYL